MKASELFDMSGRVVVVTGAASGIGRAMAEVVAANGAHVILVDRNAASLEAAAADFSDRGWLAEHHEVDVAQPASIEALIDGVVDRHGRLDCVFANAGITGGPGFADLPGRIESVSFEAWDRVMEVNLKGAFATARAAAIHMKTRREGSIVVTASVAALKASGLPSYAYVASKAGIAQVVRVMALELGPFNVRVNAIAPGPFPTGIGRFDDPETVAKFASTTVFGRMAEMDEIKGAALLLASPASSFMTGTIIPVDGGTQA